MRESHILGAFSYIIATITKSTAFQWVIASVLSFIVWLGPSDFLVRVAGGLLLFTIIDFILGIRLSLKKKKFLKSKLMGKIVDKALAQGSLIIIAASIRKIWPEFPVIILAFEFLVCLATIRELVSNLENLDQLGVPYVGAVAKALKMKADEAAGDMVDRIKEADLNPVDGK